jgi:hypothetical protein
VLGRPVHRLALARAIPDPTTPSALFKLAQLALLLVAHFMVTTPEQLIVQCNFADLQVRRKKKVEARN